jgi:hypothetical protein
MPERTKYTAQEILNLNLDETVAPARLIVGTAVWNGSAWIADGGIIKTVTVSYTASQTGATVLDPTSGTRAVITDIIISASAAGTVYLFDGTDSASTKITPTLSLAANGGVVCNFSKPSWVSAATDNIIKYTSGASAAGSILLKYYEV